MITLPWRPVTYYGQTGFLGHKELGRRLTLSEAWHRAPELSLCVSPSWLHEVWGNLRNGGNDHVLNDPNYWGCINGDADD